MCPSYQVTLEDSKVAVATLDPAKAFGPSAFGPLQFRVIANSVPGDWQRLATLVRLPVLKELKCPATADLAVYSLSSGAIAANISCRLASMMLVISGVCT